MAIDNKDKKVLNVPPLRFPEFSGKWKRVELKDVAEFQKSRIPADSLDASCYISTENLIPNFGGIKEASSIPTDGNVMAIKPNDILISNIRPYLKKVWQSDRFGGCSADVFVLRTTGCQSDFLYNIIASDKFINYAMSGVKGVKMPRGDKRQMKEFEFSIPAIEEQNRISRLLSLLDERIATQNKIIEKLESLIKGLNDSLYERYGDDIRTSFDELGYSYSGLSGKSAGDFGKGKPFITYLNVYSNNVVNEKDYQYVQIDEGEKQNVVQYGDVLFTLSSETPEEVGIGSVYLGQDEVYLNSFCFGIHIVNVELAYPPYISYYVSSTPFRKFIYPFAQGSTRFNLCKDDFEKASITLPSLDNQKRIHSVLNSVAMKISAERAMLEQYATQKQYLIRQMFI